MPTRIAKKSAKSASESKPVNAQEFRVGSLMVAAAIQRATEVLGSQTQAMRWLGTPVRALDYATPISLLEDQAGLDAVETVLGRLEHGVL